MGRREGSRDRKLYTKRRSAAKKENTHRCHVCGAQRLYNARNNGWRYDTSDRYNTKNKPVRESGGYGMRKDLNQTEKVVRERFKVVDASWISNWVFLLSTPVICAASRATRDIMHRHSGIKLHKRRRFDRQTFSWSILLSIIFYNSSLFFLFAINLKPLIFCRSPPFLDTRYSFHDAILSHLRPRGLNSHC
jgi:hypothetical protein